MDLIYLLNLIPKHLSEMIILNINPRQIGNLERVYQISNETKQKYETKWYEFIKDINLDDALDILLKEKYYSKFDQLFDQLENVDQVSLSNLIYTAVSDGNLPYIDKLLASGGMDALVYYHYDSILRILICNKNPEMLNKFIQLRNSFKNFKFDTVPINEIIDTIFILFELIGEIGDLETFEEINQLAKNYLTETEYYQGLEETVFPSAIIYGNHNIIDRLNYITSKDLIKSLDNNQAKKIALTAIEDFVINLRDFEKMIKSLQYTLCQSDYDELYERALDYNYQDFADIIEQYSIRFDQNQQ